MKRIVIPAAADKKGLNTQVAEHFGRAPYFAVVDFNENKDTPQVKIVPNVGEHVGGTGHPHDNLLDLKPTAIIAYGMGPRGLNTFKSAGVAVLKANADTVDALIAAYKKGELEELTGGCSHAHHH